MRRLPNPSHIDTFHHAEQALRTALQGTALSETHPTLGHPSAPARKQHPAPPVGVTVTLSCRPKRGGFTIRFDHFQPGTISRFEAELAARRAARAAGLDGDSAIVLDLA